MEEDKTTQFLNKEFLEKPMFDNKEYDRQFKKEIKELWNIVDNNPEGAEMALKTYHKAFVKAIKQKKSQWVVCYSPPLFYDDLC